MIDVKSLSANPQNVQTHSNNCLCAFEHFAGLALKGLMSYFRKNPDRGEGFEDMEFPGVLKKEHVEIPGAN